jgi:hypothetical protein
MVERPSESQLPGHACFRLIFPLLAFVQRRWDNPPITARRLRLFMPKLCLRMPPAARAFALAVALCPLLLCTGCGKSSGDKAAKDQAAAIQFNADKAVAAREREAMTAARREMEAANQKDIHKESEETFKKFASERPNMTTAEETKTQDDVIGRLRARMSDPAAMQVRNVHFNGQRTAICMEVNYREGGKYLGFRRAFATPDVTWVEPPPDDVSLRVFLLNFERMGCSSDTGSSTGR